MIEIAAGSASQIVPDMWLSAGVQRHFVVAAAGTAVAAVVLVAGTLLVAHEEGMFEGSRSSKAFETLR